MQRRPVGGRSATVGCATDCQRDRWRGTLSCMSAAVALPVAVREQTARPAALRHSSGRGNPPVGSGCPWCTVSRVFARALIGYLLAMTWMAVLFTTALPRK